MKTLTEKELKIMNVLWNNNGLMMRELYEHLPEPRTHFNTISTFVRRLVEKGFITSEALEGRVFKYYAAITRVEYERKERKSVIDRLFNGSSLDFVKHLVQEDQLTKEDLEELIRLIEEQKV